jgi:hypothetical protein
MKLTDAQRTLLGIIASVEAGVTAPEDAVKELALLKNRAKISGLSFKADYTLSDFQKIREAYASTYDYNEVYVESSSSY